MYNKIHNKWNILKISLIYLLSGLVGTFMYVLLFNRFHDEVNKVPLLGAISLLFLACMFTILLLIYLLKILKFRIIKQDYILIFTLIFFFNYNLYGLIPFNVSRSNSIIVMGYLKANDGKPKTENEIKEFVEEKYFVEYQAIQKRLNEQVSAGNIKFVNNGYIITPRGLFVLNLFSKITSFYNVENDFTQVKVKND